MTSIDGGQRPALNSIRQASTNAMDKAKLMVGLNKEETDTESQQSERNFLDEAADLFCPDLTFQQVRRTFT
jgi:RNA polymerase-interacting CarD/CdnL/TRCF family regulator